jgi:hypothetical protein
MQVSREDLSKNYASLCDLELLAIDRNELTDLALQCYDHEVEHRHLSEKTEPDDLALEMDAHDDVPDWLDTAYTACSFQVGTGARYAEEAEQACTILRDAGIPSQVVTEHKDGVRPDLISVMVPAALSLKATSVLDRDMFNQELEETWRNHFDELSDEELCVLNADDLCSGLLDRAARLKRVYEEALARRESGANARARAMV